ncbi:MAG: nucleotidyltransferase family protein [bacterium]
MEALILAGGRGSRVNELSESVNKCMIKMMGKPLLEYNLDILAKLDIQEVIIVVAYKAEDIINTFGTNYSGMRIKYVIQREQKGLVHAIETAKTYLDDDFILMLGDEILVETRHVEMVGKFHNNKIFAICGVVPVENKMRICKTYSIFFNEKNRILRLVEKPKKPLNNLMGTGNCIFSKEIVNYIEITPISHERGEKELPDLIQCAIDDGEIIEYFEIANYYYNINSYGDLREAESLISELAEKEQSLYASNLYLRQKLNENSYGK